jgi:hypothetical protein
MFSLVDLLWLVLLGGGVFYLWRSSLFTGQARKLADAHCRQLNLQLLDQSMVICALWPVRGADGRLVIRRRYRFEFSSTGDRRYQGELVMLGLQLEHIELETYKLPSED